MKESLPGQGPELTPLLHWLTHCPPEFLMHPLVRHQENISSGIIHTDAVVSDLLRYLTNNPLTPTEAQVFAPPRDSQACNRLSLVLVCAYLFSHPWLRNYIQQLPNSRKILYTFLKDGLTALAAEVKAAAFVSDPERREELVRLCLKTFSLRPAGETEIQALDRLLTVNSLERKKVLRESLAAHKRAEEIRQAMARKEAEEAASKMTRE